MPMRNKRLPGFLIRHPPISGMFSVCHYKFLYRRCRRAKEISLNIVEIDIQSLLNLRPPLTIIDLNIPIVSPHVTSYITLSSTPKRRRIALLTRDQRIQIQTLQGIR